MRQLKSNIEGSETKRANINHALSKIKLSMS